MSEAAMQALESLAHEEDRFVIDSDEKAEWAMRKIAEKEATIKTFEDFYARQFQKVVEENGKDIEFFTGLLQAYFHTVPHKSTKTQDSYALPSGKLILKNQQPEYLRTDDDLIPWLKENAPEYVKITVKESVDWSSLKQCVTPLPDGTASYTLTGEVIPGVDIAYRPPVFEVKRNV